MVGFYKKILGFLSKKERKRFFILGILLTLASLLEVASLASILPLLSVLSQGAESIESGPVGWAYRFFGFESLYSFQIVLTVFVLVAVVGGLIIKAGSVYAQTRFSAMRGYTISTRLLQGYLHQDYLYFGTQHSSELSKRILNEVQQLVGGSILPAVQLIASSTLVIFIAILIFFIEPFAAISAALVVGSIYSLLFAIIRKRITIMGAQQMQANRQRFQITHEAFGGIKYLKLRHYEEEFTGYFQTVAKRFAELGAKRELIGKLPRFVLEGVAFTALIIYILVLLAQNANDFAEIVPTLGVVAFAGIRLLPAMQQVFSAVTVIRNNTAIRDALADDIESTRKNEINWVRDKITTRHPFKESLVLEDIAFAYPNAARPAITGMNMTIHAGQVVGIVGGTGAGKTTIADIILGLITPDRGQFKVDDTEITGKVLPMWQHSIGYVPQTIFLTDDTVAANIAFGLKHEDIDMERIREVARIAALDRFVNEEMPDGYETRIGEGGVRLSGGQRQRIGIARALYHDPDLLVLDEATSALDNITEQAVMNAIHNMARDKTVIMIAHRLSTVKPCDKIFLLEKGRVSAAGRFEELVEQSDVFRQMSMQDYEV